LKNVEGLMGVVAEGIASKNVVFASRLFQRRVSRDHSYQWLMERIFRAKDVHVYSGPIAMLLGRRHHPYLKIYLEKKLTRMRYSIVFIYVFCKI
jgi:hypothetical protein